MNFFFLIIVIFFLQNCSFDNKTGIWDNNIVEKNNKNDLFKDFKTIDSQQKKFDQTIVADKSLKFNLSPIINNLNWSDYYYGAGNNLENFSYNNSNNIIFKSAKLTKHRVDKLLLYQDNNLIISDNMGNIILYSLSEEKIISKFNFYKKKYKKIEKKLNLIINNKIIYVSDNIGYFYAYDYEKNKIIWAKNLKIPFRSNIKIHKNKIFTANQENTLLIFNNKNGNLIKKIPTEETILKNQFINNLSISNDTLFFLNSYGSLYSLNIENLKLNWFLNLNQSLEINSRFIFDGSGITNNQNVIIISSYSDTYIIDKFSGNIIKKFNFSYSSSPIIDKNYIFIITKNNFLVTIDLKNYEIIYSYNISSQIKKNLKKYSNDPNISKMFLANGKIMLLDDSHIFNFNPNGKFNNLIKLSNKINSLPIFISQKFLYLNNKNKLVILN